MRIRLPGPDQRTAIVGRTGSGKTTAAVWLLSQSDFDERPWVILDFKRDKLLNSIARAEPATYEELPDDPGIYILHVTPGEEEQVDEWFKRVWQRENIGLLVDEGYMVDKYSRWFNACLTQGRSKRIQMIVLSQRPVWLSRFVFSEADFFMVFDLTHVKDQEKIAEYVRDDERHLLARPLDYEHFESYYYDVGRRHLEVLEAAPDAEELLQTIDSRLVLMDLQDEETGEYRPLRRAI